MLILIEGIVLCALFTLMIEIITHTKREAMVNDYPPVVTDKLREMGLIAETPPKRSSDVLRKVIGVTVYVAIFALMLRFINGTESFLSGVMTSYILWLIVDWFDFAVIDVLLAPFDKFYKLAKVSAFDKSAVWFHFKASLRGTLIGIPFALLTGLCVALMEKMFG